MLPSPLIRELRTIREELGQTQGFLATTLGVNRSMLGEWENGTHSPSLRNVERWAKALGYELDLHKVKEPSHV